MKWPIATVFELCPYGWVNYGNRCFIYAATRVNWALAEETCQRYGGHLVSIHNENEYQTVKALIRTHEYSDKPTWIGLSGCQQKFKWFWSDATTVTFKWNHREPNNFFKECCVHINFGKQKDWNDINCKKQYPFVCAKGIY
ncbi:lactose-binding lectin l-2-like [Tachysurus vachellii]|uniref:lactose-binding lectin l-2-like n=1 Tax=Tachysurus vachellii TaxID=175792 RepID=UPI00296B3D7D|nr:lactose-binding lectin l-2-like [Tachysurus vachellii]